MRIIIINKKLILGLLILSFVFTTGLLYSQDMSNRILSVMNKDKLLPIYCVDVEEKKVAISFDAAWGDQFTEGILEILDKYNIKATFFLVGFWVDKYPDMVKKIHEKGHDVENHSTTHPHMSKLSTEQIANELNTTSDKIEKLTGIRPTLFRPPFGDYNNKVIETVMANQHYVIQWDVDSLDWKELGVEPVVDRVTRNVKKGSIVLFHNNAKYVLEYLPLVIERLQKEGYEIVPISQIIIKDNFYMDHTGMQRKINTPQ
ncbi:MAG: polysaccharide deacetylase family protein [Thermotaleaceae bacterium]